MELKHRLTQGTRLLKYRINRTFVGLKPGNTKSFNLFNPYKSLILAYQHLDMYAPVRAK